MCLPRTSPFLLLSLLALVLPLCAECAHAEAPPGAAPQSEPHSSSVPHGAAEPTPGENKQGHGAGDHDPAHETVPSPDSSAEGGGGEPQPAADASAEGTEDGHDGAHGTDGDSSDHSAHHGEHGAADSHGSPTATPAHGSRSAGVKKKVRPRYPTPHDFSGLYYGYVLAVDAKKRFIFVMPYEEDLPRRRFYLDSKTIYRRDGKKAKLSDVQVGSRVALRFFARNDLALADGVFIVDGDFEDGDYKMPARKLAVPSGGGGKAGGGGGGGHH